MAIDARGKAPLEELPSPPATRPPPPPPQGGNIGYVDMAGGLPKEGPALKLRAETVGHVQAIRSGCSVVRIKVPMNAGRGNQDGTVDVNMITLFPWGCNEDGIAEGTMLTIYSPIYRSGSGTRDTVMVLNPADIEVDASSWGSEGNLASDAETYRGTWLPYLRNGIKDKEGPLFEHFNRDLAECYSVLSMYDLAEERIQDIDSMFYLEIGLPVALATHRYKVACHNLNYIWEHEREVIGRPDVFQANFAKAQVLLDQSLTGNYEGVRLLPDETGTQAVADYVGPVEIRKKDGKVGLFATKCIPAKTTVLVSNASVHKTDFYPTEPDPGADMDPLFREAATLAIRYPKFRCQVRWFANLLCKDGVEHQVPETVPLFGPNQHFKGGTNPICDNEEGRMNYAREMNDVMSDVKAVVQWWYDRKVFDGVWMLPAFIDHSCEPNVSELHLGLKGRLYRAVRDIEADEEILFSYVDVAFPQRKKFINGIGIDCDCSRCSIEEAFVQKWPDIESVFVHEYDDLTLKTAAFTIELALAVWPVLESVKCWVRLRYLTAFVDVYPERSSVEKWGFLKRMLEANPGSKRLLMSIFRDFKEDVPWPFVVDALKLIYGENVPFDVCMELVLTPDPRDMELVKSASRS